MPVVGKSGQNWQENQIYQNGQSSMEIDGKNGIMKKDKKWKKNRRKNVKETWKEKDSKEGKWQKIRKSDGKKGKWKQKR